MRTERAERLDKGEPSDVRFVGVSSRVLDDGTRIHTLLSAMALVD